MSLRGWDVAVSCWLLPSLPRSRRDCELSPELRLSLREIDGLCHQPAEHDLLPAAPRGALIVFLPQARADRGDQDRRDRGGRARLPGLAAAVVPLRPGRRRAFQFGYEHELDPLDRRQVPRRRRRHLGAAHPADHAARLHRGLLARAPRSRTAQKEYYVFLLLLQTGMLGVFISLDIVPLLRVLGGDAGPDVLPDRDLGRAAQALRGDQVLPLHAGRLGADAGRHPGPLLLQLDRSGRDRPQGLGNASTFDVTELLKIAPQIPRTSSSGSSSPSSSASRSRCRCSRSTPGCPTPTSRRRRPAP